MHDVVTKVRSYTEVTAPQASIALKEASRKPGIERIETLDKLRLFCEGINPPHVRAREFAIGVTLMKEVQSKGLSVKELAHRCGMRASQVMPVMQGLFRLELFNDDTLNRIAEYLKIDTKELMGIADKALRDGREPKNKFGQRVLSNELSEQTNAVLSRINLGLNGNLPPELIGYETAIDTGIGARFNRNMLGISRKDLEETTGVHISMIIWLEHCVLPFESFGRDLDMFKIARGLGQSPTRLRDEGRKIRSAVLADRNVGDVDELVEAVKDHTDIVRAKRGQSFISS